MASPPPRPPTCQCNHGGGPFDPQPCGEPARFRAVVEDAFAYDLCRACAEDWARCEWPEERPGIVPL